MAEGSPSKDYTVMEVAANEEEENVENIDHSESITHRNPWSYLKSPDFKEYLKSADFKEILCCVVCSALLAVLTAVPGIPLNIRPIPFQALQNSGDIVVNLSLDNELTGDTVPNELAVVLAFIIPLVLQL
jgi:hypothetical protein